MCGLSKRSERNAVTRHSEPAINLDAEVVTERHGCMGFRIQNAARALDRLG